MSDFPLVHQRDKRALLVGSFLIVAVSIFFISRSFFFENSDTVTTLSSMNNATQSSIPFITPDILLKKIQNGDSVDLIDVRDEASYKAEHIAHSLSLPIGSLQNFSPVKDKMVVIVLSENDPILFEAARNIMENRSFSYFFLKGGFESWKAFGAPVVSVGDPNSFTDQSKITYLSIEECKNLLTQNAPVPFILDVQTEDNFKKKHLVGAINIPLDQLEKRQKEIPAGKIIIVYGENDLASFRGGVRLSDLGIFSARTLTGNYLSPLSGLPLEP